MTNEPDVLTKLGNEALHGGSALIALVDTFRLFDGELAGLMCREAETIAYALGELGGTRGREAGDNVLLRHGVLDDEIDDEHHDIFHEQGGKCPDPERCPVLHPEPDPSDDVVDYRKEQPDA